MTVAGGLQIEENSPLTVSIIYDQTTSGNGKSYVIETGLPMSSKKSLYAILKEREDCSLFLDLLFNGGSANPLLKTRLSSYTCADYNCSLFDAYNYTVYVPTNAEIQKLIDQGYLPTWTDFEELTAERFGGNATALKTARKIVADRILNFLKYHIQDNSVYIGGEPTNNVKYETSTLNPVNNRFFSVTVNADDSNLTIADQLGNTRRVLTNGGNYNVVGREYWIQNANNVNSTNLYNASDLVVHQIDGPLFFEQKQLTSWQEEVDAIPVEAKGRR